MSHFVEGNYKTFRVGAADIPAGSAVKLTAGLLVVAAAATDKILGVVEAKAYLTKLADVHLRSAAGTISIVAGGTIAAGDAVTSNGSGLGITTTTAADQIIGYALEAGTAGKTVELMPSTAKV
jgi:hypothetical protein